MSDGSTARQAAPPGGFDVVIVGAGFSGLYMLYRARELGCRARVFEAGSDVGGTWYWNRYPGARCDSESVYYSYSFSEELEQEWPLIERYPAQPTILSYLQHVADRFALRDDIVFNTRVVSATYDEPRNLWLVRTDSGVEVSARFLITAVGCLSSANKPELPGRERFRGACHHTSEWPHEGVDYCGKRVAIIGTGSTGIQLIPEVAKTAAHLTVFQRTPQFTLPARNRALDPAYVESIKSNYRDLRQRCRESTVGTDYVPSNRSALEATPDERQKAYEEAWQRGGARFIATFNDILVSVDANQTAADFVRAKIDEIVRDPEVAEMLKPTTYPIGTKRIPIDSGYYETFNRENVQLVDLGRTPLVELTEDGIRTTEREFPVDIVIFATGFDALTGPLLRLNLVGRGGTELREKWSGGPRTFLGLATAGFPNLFTITGPGSPSVLTNMPVSIEQHVEWIQRCLRFLQKCGADTIEATTEAEDAWTDHVNQAAARTLYPRAASWYVGANIEGKPRTFLPYIGGVANYRKICDEIADDDYRGFRIPGRPTVTDVRFDVSVSR
jgi:cation diffusion facilitator CzcD-associated flavoprotein CzcO